MNLSPEKKVIVKFVCVVQAEQKCQLSVFLQILDILLLQQTIRLSFLIVPHLKNG